MKITCTLSPESLLEASKQFAEYAESLQSKTEKLVRSLGEYGAEQAVKNYGTDHIDTGETVESIMYIHRGTSGYVQAGGAAVWIEFGTGVIKNNGASHPKAGELGMSAWGTYGKGYGANPHGWYFPSRYFGWTLTQGIQMNPFMYNTSQDMRRELLDKAKEVFRTL